MCVVLGKGGQTLYGPVGVAGHLLVHIRIAWNSVCPAEFYVEIQKEALPRSNSFLVEFKYDAGSGHEFIVGREYIRKFFPVFCAELRQIL